LMGGSPAELTSPRGPASNPYIGESVTIKRHEAFSEYGFGS
jgi:hypothetical protein